MSVIIKTSILTVFGILAFSFASAAMVSPSVIDVKLNSGESDVVTFAVLNDGTEKTDFIVSIIGIELGGGSDELTFVPYTGEAKLSLSDKTFNLDAGMGKEIGLLIEVPDGTISQENTFAVQIRENIKNNSSISVSEGLVSLVFLQIGNQIEENLEILDYSTDKNFYSSLPVNLFLTIRNNGKNIVQPSGEIVVTNILGFKKHEFALNPELRRIPGGQQRTIDILWGDNVDDRGFISELKQESTNLKFGVYKASFNIMLSSDVEVSNDGIWFVIFPWRLVLVLLSLFGGLTLLLRVARRK